MVENVESLLEAKEISAEKLDDLMETVDLCANAVAYQILTTRSLRRKVLGLSPKKRYPEFCLSYLVRCVETDGMPDADITHNRAEALFELKVPLDRFWEQHSAGLSPADYWDRTRAMIDGLPSDYCDSVVTHWLEGCVKVRGFKAAMKDWKKNCRTKRYVEELEKISGRVF